MLRSTARRGSVKARVVRDLDLAPERAEARALIERQRRRMIERAGVHPDARDLPRPRQLQRAIHQPAPGAAADQVSGHAEEGEFALTGLAKVQFEQTLVAPLVHQRMDIDHRRANDRGQVRVHHLQPRKPQPFLADAAIEIAKPVQIRRRRPAQRPRALGIAAKRRTFGHLQMRDHGRDLAGGNVRITRRGGSSFKHPPLITGERPLHLRPPSAPDAAASTAARLASVTFASALSVEQGQKRYCTKRTSNYYARFGCIYVYRAYIRLSYNECSMTAISEHKHLAKEFKMVRRVIEDQTYMTDDLLFPHLLGRSFYVQPEARPQTNDKEYFRNSQFWNDVLDSQKVVAERVVRLNRFNIFEWIPRNPGLFHTEQGAQARHISQYHIQAITGYDYEAFERKSDAPPDHAATFRDVTSGTRSARNVIYTPQGKASMLQGGIGCIRLRPVEWKTGGIRWFMSASSSTAPDEGIPLLMHDDIYQRLIDQIRQKGSRRCNIIGRTKFIPIEFSDLYSKHYRIQRLYIDVSKIEDASTTSEFGQVSVAASFLSHYEGRPKIYASYVTFDPGYKGAQESATDWMHEEYIRGLYKGVPLTDFDQQATEIPDTLFSLDQVLTSPDLARTIATLKDKFGNFDWDMLKNSAFSFYTHQEQIMVKSVVNGENHRVNITTGSSSPITTQEGVTSTYLPATPQERYRHLYTLLAWGTGVLFLIALLIISLIFPNPTPPQLKIQASILSLAAAGFATVMSGLMNITTKVGTQLAIGASGAFAVLVLFYLQNPAILN
jgi:hypothetical protein